MARIPISPLVFASEMLPAYAREAHDLFREWETGDEASNQFTLPWTLQVWHGHDPSWRPATCHPLAHDFAWSDWDVAKTVRGQDSGSWQEGASRVGLAEEALRREGLLRFRLEELERQIDAEAYRIYGLDGEERQIVEEELMAATGANESDLDPEDQDEEEPTAAAELTVEEHIARTVHYFAGQVVREATTALSPSTLSTSKVNGGQLVWLSRFVRP